jgi:phage N-6-adenine-methyltransferase
MKGNMGNREHVCFSSGKDDWGTPQKLFDLLNGEFAFECDLAATEQNTKCNVYYDDALERDWAKFKSSFLNPPYTQNKAFIKKAYEESLKGTTIVCLVPSRTDTLWWHDYCMKANELRFMKGRLYFNDEINPAPFPSCIVVFKNHDQSYPSISAIDARLYRNYKSKRKNTSVV